MSTVDSMLKITNCHYNVFYIRLKSSSKFFSYYVDSFLIKLYLLVIYCLYRILLLYIIPNYIHNFCHDRHRYFVQKVKL